MMTSNTDLAKISIDDLLAEVHGRGYNATKEPLTTGQTVKIDLARWRGNKYRFGVATDSHLGSRYQALTALHTFYRILGQRKIGTCLFLGDLVDGTHKMHRGMEYEQFAHGADAQRKYAVKNFPKVRGVKTLGISGNHDQSFYKDSGVDVVAAFAEDRDDFTYLGANYATVDFNGLKIALLHPVGGTSYARSYKIQKRIESMPSGNSKPNLLFAGHWHIACHIPGYRNVEAVMCGAFQWQTPFLLGLGLNPQVCGLIVTVQPDAKGLASVTYEWIPFYEVAKDDY